MLLAVSFKDEICRASIPITSHENRHLFIRKPTLLGLATPFSAFDRRFVTPFVRPQKVSLVGFGNTNKCMSLHGLWQCEEPMAPAECGADSYVHALSRFVDRQPVSQGGGLRQPLSLHAQVRQWRTGQGVERLAAGSALVPLETVGRAILNYPLGTAVRAARLVSRAALDHFNRCCLARSRRKLRNDLLPLHPRQFPQVLYQYRQFSLSHFALLVSAPSRHESSIHYQVAR
jgi:hypothetical protein